MFKGHTKNGIFFIVCLPVYRQKWIEMLTYALKVEIDNFLLKLIIKKVLHRVIAIEK